MTKFLGIFYLDEDNFSLACSEYFDTAPFQFFHNIQTTNRLPLKLALDCYIQRHNLENQIVFLNLNPKTSRLIKTLDEIPLIRFKQFSDYHEIQKIANLMINDKIKFNQQKIEDEAKESLSNDVNTRKMSLLVGSIAVSRQIEPESFHHADVIHLATNHECGYDRFVRKSSEFGSES